MRLPDGFLDELQARTSLSQIVGRKVVWDRRKTNQSKGDWWAPCPFHHEKTASFHVDDRKGFYYCFGCQAKGNLFRFVQETENVGFLDAVEILAREVGMEMPKADPQAQARADRFSVLAEVMEEALRWTRLQLKTAAAAEARAYLAGQRGLDEAAWDRWELGFAPAQGLVQALAGKGIPMPDLLEAGLAAPSQRGGAPYDRFRNRILFPIRDARGRAIAFGGRAMDPNDRAKYLNSPETPLFDKGRTLYNLKRARAAAGPDSPLIVAEGYMDVIALGEAGFAASVAPLGTAVTELQLQLMWRVHPEPVIALDGDQAGLRAAFRVVDLALPMLSAGQSLRFALMPGGQDPDDVLRQSGADAMRQILGEAMPLVDLLWQRETEGQVFDSPERKAALDRRLAEATGKIADQGLRRHYDDALRDRKWQLFRGQRARPAVRGGGGGGGFAPTRVRSESRQSALAQADAAELAEQLHDAVILAGLAAFPDLVAEVEAQLDSLVFTDPALDALRQTLLRHAAAADPVAAATAEIGRTALDRLMAAPHVANAPVLQPGCDATTAALCVKEALTKRMAIHQARIEAQDAMDAYDDERDAAASYFRLQQSLRALDAAMRFDGDEGMGQVEVGRNGVKMDRNERAALDSLLARIDPSKKGTGQRAQGKHLGKK